MSCQLCRVEIWTRELLSAETVATHSLKLRSASGLLKSCLHYSTCMIGMSAGQFNYCAIQWNFSNWNDYEIENNWLDVDGNGNNGNFWNRNNIKMEIKTLKQKRLQRKRKAYVNWFSPFVCYWDRDAVIELTRNVHLSETQRACWYMLNESECFRSMQFAECWLLNAYSKLFVSVKWC